MNRWIGEKFVFTKFVADCERTTDLAAVEGAGEWVTWPILPTLPADATAAVESRAWG